MTSGASLAWLLEPLGVEEFLEDIWGTTHHLVRRCQPEYFDELFGASTLEEFLEFGRPDPNVVRLVRTKEEQPPDAYRLVDGSIDLVRLRNEFASGYTLVLNGLERYVPTIAVLSHALEVELNFETQVNAYITPPESQGFMPHYDDHDVLILQIEGSKTWHVYDRADVPNHQLHRREAFVDTDLPEPSDVLLDAGDVLYVPRGRVHAAESHGRASIHLTVGLHPPTVLSLLTQTLEALSFSDDRVLQRLPPRYLSDSAVRERLGELVEGVTSVLAHPDVLGDGLGGLEDAILRRGRCRPVGQLVSNAVDADRIDVESTVAKYQPLYSRVLAMDGGVALQFAHSLVHAGDDHRSAMLFVSRSTAPFRVGDLPELSPVQQVELARKLVVDGFLVRLPDG